MSTKTVMSIIGPRESAIRVGGLCRDIYHMYSTASSDFVEVPNFYEKDPTILDMEKDGKNFAAAVKKICQIHDMHSKIESVGCDIVVVNNYIDEIILQFIYNELRKVGDLSKEEISTIENKASTLIALALQEFKLRLPSFAIPVNSSNNPSEVNYPPIIFDIYKRSISQFALYEYSDYIFPDTEIQVVAYYAFGLYNRFCNAITNPESGFVTLDNIHIPGNHFALIQGLMMDEFENHLSDPSQKINFNGKAVFEPLYVKDMETEEEETETPSENYQIEENDSDELVQDIPDISEEEVIEDSSEPMEEIVVEDISSEE